MTFHKFITNKYPLYADADLKVNLTVGELLELVQEWTKANRNLRVPKICMNCKHFQYNKYCNLLKCYMEENGHCCNYKQVNHANS